jgi:membrane-associated phospholipid phosphatase
MAVMHYKSVYQRARPSQLWPDLMPPIDVPGHASFPSGHATESWMVALTLQRIILSTVPVVVPDVVDVTERLAQRIGRNREVLGLHYPSDSAGGKLLAQNVFGLFNTCPTVLQLYAGAKTEWEDFAT